MLFVAYWAVILVLGALLIKQLRQGNNRLALAIAMAWAIGFFAFPLLGIAGGLYFTSFGALLVLILLYVDLYQQHRKPARSPLEDLPAEPPPDKRSRE